MLEGKKLVSHLNDLLQLEHDATRAYELAIQYVDERGMRLQLLQFHGDHQRHLHELTRFIIEADGTPKERPDLKGPFLAGMTAIMSTLGTKNAVRVMIQNENVTNKAYDAAVEDQYPPGLAKEIRQFRDDERRHRSWLEQKLAELAGTGKPEEIRPEDRP
jgi:rubrerythrin